VSRIGRLPIDIPSGVSVHIHQVDDGNQVTVEGPKGQLTCVFSSEMSIEIEGSQVLVKRPSDERRHRALHGLTRALMANMVKGVSEGYRKDLEILGVGYRASQRGDVLILSLGYSHPIEIVPPAGITFTVTAKDGRSVGIEGIDKQLVGKVAADIRALRKPEPYKGKGVRYVGETVRRKAGKAGKAA
jgi:large subunit ribosomal protein L6